MDRATLQRLSVLETVLSQLADRHEQLVSLMQRQREALRIADHRGVGELSRLENSIVQAISELEKKRLGLVADLTGFFVPDAAQPLRMGDLAEHLPEPQRGRVLVLRAQLRDRIIQVKEQSSVSRRATEALMKHMQGLVQTLSQVSSQGAAYSSKGRIEQSSVIPVMGTLNLTA